MGLDCEKMHVMPPVVSDKVLDRVRKFKAMAASPNEHEADTARRRLNELYRQHNISEGDIIDEATEVAVLGYALDGNQRVELSRQVAKSRGCKTLVKREGIAFTGSPPAAKDSRQLYTALVGIVESNCELSPGQRYTDNDHLAWRTCFWLGYVAAVQRQLDPEHGSTPQEALTTIVQRIGDSAPQLLKRVADGLLRDHSPEEADQWRRAAYAAGEQLGVAVPIPAFRRR